ncbi:MAG: VCBS repeat-containing protein, partial [Planctomycetales bacterium]|nr:VCBS repeat-containing protein [Planctomycetales bacterium]
GLPNRLYLQAEDGTLQDVSAKANVDWLEETRSALLVDLDNDRDLDLVVATVAGIVFAENNGKAVFRIRAAIPGSSDAYSMAAADYDNDHDVDIYITAYGPNAGATRARGFEAAMPVPYDDANNGGNNLLLQNEGQFQFRDVTQAVGLDENNQRFSFAAAWEDYDADGDMDLYVANDFGRNNLYKNQDGRFRDVASDAGVEDRAGGMSVSWGDANLDGHADIYVGNMFSAAGSRVTYQRRFLSTRSSERSSSLQRMARGNTLFLADSKNQFADASLQSSAWMGRWAWGSKFADLNNDGLEDLIVANGYFTNRRTDDL